MADFATVTELETFMGTSGLGARGTAMLGYASAAIRFYCGQDIDAVTGRQESYAGEWNQYVIRVTQVPVTAATMTVAAVAFTEFWSNYQTGDFYKLDGTAWDDDPIVITYDSGFDNTSDEFLAVKSVCLEVAARAMGGPAEPIYGDVTPELRGASPAIFLTETEMRTLDQLKLVGVG